MKKTTLLFLIVASISFAQKQANRFEASADGFVDYIVLDFEGSPMGEGSRTVNDK